MRRTAQFAFVSIAALALGGCFGGRPIRYYTVENPPAVAPETSAYPVSLLIGRIGGPEIMEDQPIAYRYGKNEIGTYRYHLWIEPPVEMLKVMLFRRLRASGKFQSIGEMGSSAKGEFVLHGRLYDFEEVDSGGIGALVTMEFELIDRKSGKTVWTHFYSNTQPVQGKEVSDVVSALDQNLSQGLTETLSSLDAFFSARPSEKQ